VKLPLEGREYWKPGLADVPPGYTVLAARFTPQGGPVGAWHPMVTVGSDKAVLIAGPNVDTAESANPAGTVVLAAGHPQAEVKCVGGDEVLIRDAGRVDVE
jgi:hypothetical protein